jgi:hypothetical protein
MIYLVIIELVYIVYVNSHLIPQITKHKINWAMKIKHQGGEDAVRRAQASRARVRTT